MKPIEFDGEGEATIFAKDQPQYEPLPAHVLPGPERIVHSRWELTDEERALVIAGAAIDLKCWTFGKPLQPVLLEVAEDSLTPSMQRFARAAAKDLRTFEQQLLEGAGAGDVAPVDPLLAGGIVDSTVRLVGVDDGCTWPQVKGGANPPALEVRPPPSAPPVPTRTTSERGRVCDCV